MNLAGRTIFPRQRKHLAHRSAVLAVELQTCQHPYAPPFTLPCLTNAPFLAVCPTKPGIAELGGRHRRKNLGCEAHLPDGQGEPSFITQGRRRPAVGRGRFGPCDTVSVRAISPKRSVSGEMLSTKRSETVRISVGSSSKRSHTSSSV